MAKSFDLWYLVMPGHWGGAGSGAEGAGKPRPCCRQLGGTASQQRATQENHIKALLDPNFQVSKPHILLNTFIFIKKKKKTWKKRSTQLSVARDSRYIDWKDVLFNRDWFFRQF